LSALFPYSEALIEASIVGLDGFDTSTATIPGFFLSTPIYKISPILLTYFPFPPRSSEATIAGADLLLTSITLNPELTSLAARYT